MGIRTYKRLQEIAKEMVGLDNKRVHKQYKIVRDKFDRHDRDYIPSEEEDGFSWLSDKPKAYNNKALDKKYKLLEKNHTKDWDYAHNKLVQMYSKPLAKSRKKKVVKLVLNRLDKDKMPKIEQLKFKRKARKSVMVNDYTSVNLRRDDSFRKTMKEYHDKYKKTK